MKDKLILKDNHSEGEGMSSNLAQAAWAVTQKNLRSRECGGAHHRLSRMTELVVVPLVSPPTIFQELAV